MVERIPQHRHCQYCDKAILYKDKFCDEKCESEHKAKMQAKKRQLNLFYVVMVVLFIMVLILSLSGYL